MKNLFLLPTDKPSRLIIQNGNKLILGKEEYSITENKQNIYITSDEEIKEGYYFDLDINKVLKYPIGCYNKGNKKIILTTDQELIKDGVQAIDDEFLEWFVKNPSCEFIKVELHVGSLRWSDSKNTYKIIIPKEEPKQYSKVLSENGNELFFDEQGYLIKEEAKQETLLQIANRKLMSNDWLNGAEFGAKWQQEQDNNKYSQEDIINALHNVELKDKKDYSKIYNGMKEWFEQNKKK